MPAIEYFDNLKIEMVGRDGSYWCVSGPGMAEQGVFMLPNPQGIYDAEFKTLFVPGPFGDEYVGKRSQKREMIIPLYVYADDPHTWRTIDAQLRWAFDYDELATIYVTTADGTRWLKVRMQEAPKYTYEKNPHLLSENPVVYTFAAEFPFWQDDPVETVWETLNTQDLHRFHVENPGDIPVWLKWTLTDRALWTLPDFSWGNDMYSRGEQDRGRTIPLPELKAGEDIEVDSDPRVQTIIAANSSPVQHRWKGNDLLYPLMPGKHGEIPVQVKNAEFGGALKLTVPRWFSRPWSHPWAIL
ncbi:hypothetical protein [Mycobacteroides abscessus]|uniref:hypothetical protein n=1 Tax=Mycobacteroides abscessus TaxID=36809 RepID=UPI000D3E5D80|nr:hypothetical protein [Mycobacteroides abscessus]PVB19730.1 hypothetical protein DDJ40_08200 [Mycobacteroides abscessus]RIU40333.1 hypothetical protein D2E83_11215 [Mycobacteroides abscessus]